MNRHVMAKDERWRDVGSLENALAIIAAIKESTHFIRTHATRFDPLNPVQNMYSIKREADTLAKLLETLHGYVAQQRNGLEQEIRNGNQ